MSIPDIRDLRPRTRRVRTHTVRPGDVVCEEPGWPMRVHRVRRRRQGDGLALWVTYVWQELSAPPWALAPRLPHAVIRKAVR